jgi:hypothetical protein
MEGFFLIVEFHIPVINVLCRVEFDNRPASSQIADRATSPREKRKQHNL